MSAIDRTDAELIARHIADMLANPYEDEGAPFWVISDLARRHPAVYRANVAIEAAQRAAVRLVARDLEGLIAAEIQRREAEKWVGVIASVLALTTRVGPQYFWKQDRGDLVWSVMKVMHASDYGAEGASFTVPSASVQEAMRRLSEPAPPCAGCGKACDGLSACNIVGKTWCEPKCYERNNAPSSEPRIAGAVMMCDAGPRWPFRRKHGDVFLLHDAEKKVDVYATAEGRIALASPREQFRWDDSDMRTARNGLFDSWVRWLAALDAHLAKKGPRG